MQKKPTVVMLCAGGPAPGMNTVVATIAKRFLNDDYRVIGLNYGYKTLFTETPDIVEFDYLLADRIYDKGGSFLKMSRYKPKDNEFSSDFFEKENIKLLVTVGGDDTASTANRLSIYLKQNNVNIQNIHVPKTIDNDLPLPKQLPTFGYQTAKNIGVNLAKTVLEDARTSDNWFIVSAMGREAGHLALGIGIACHYSVIIIPEMFDKTKISINKIVKLVVSSMIKRKLMGLGFGGAIISEGVFHEIAEEELKNSGIQFSFDEHGHPELGKVSKAHIFNELVQLELKKIGLSIKSRPEEIGYEMRCVNPTAFDLRYCTQLANGVKILFDKGLSQCIVVANTDGSVEPLYLKDISGNDGKVKPRVVDVNTDMFKFTLQQMEVLHENDIEKAKSYIANANKYTLNAILN